MVSTQWKLGVSLLLVSAVSFAEEGVRTGSFPVERRNVVTVSVPIQNLTSQVSLEGERVLGERFSVGLGVFASLNHAQSRFKVPEPSGLEGFDNTSFELGLAPSVRFYLTGRAPEGLWLAPRFEVGVGRSSSKMVGDVPDSPSSDDDDTDTRWSVGGTAVLGYSMVLEPGFTVQGGVGLGARRETLAYDSLRLGESGAAGLVRIHQATWLFTQRIVLNVGWAF
ncbi:hypothetical protein [Corallococcus carmarthensis]|uniref:Outer membrane protein beta-barrel domain-containing protein n=1 Tax=Corallococcus carmarthensis TaxID=2316728 RepID=A0A3A8K4X9_9BACT|nr:hypothetical protein [Corallococcus carmarthensis]NOK21140.1 hypothetical protein [Corallococcus carmarthensis]RKG99394.1 hypothetical protein D7X32_26675 [Corallococcus carmarthensis]